MDSQKATSLLRALVQQNESLGYRDDTGLDQLKRRAEMILKQIFGNKTKYSEDLNDISFYPRIAPSSEEYKTQQWNSGKGSLKNLLLTALEEVDLSEAAPEGSPPERKTVVGRKVFVVHGHDEALKQMVARALEQLDLEPIILHEQPNKGRTIIEKFEDYSDVAFALVLLTPDDMAYGSQEDPSTARPRGRQNVILELGFFLGKLGRNRVAALHTGEDIELPTDYSGVLFIPVDSAGRWQFDLVKELKGCGIEVDANKLIGK